MRTRIRSSGVAGVMIGLALAACDRAPGQGSTGAAQGAGATRVRPAFSHELPRLNGEHLAAKLVEVSYGPGESSPPHSHPCPVIGYVLDGAIRSQVRGEPEGTYRAGESFYEAPNGVHQVSANASKSKPARLLAYFVCDGDAPLTTPVADTGTAGSSRP
ncbi:MAG TPA: cupin domain-containing protein [Gemmatimonadales bacterium]|nr:cupin domain-containing protein [Gemmatimonadales bacterium]